jgi:hypothetical protein
MSDYVKSARCPGCGASIDLSEGKREVTCGHCGGTIVLDTGYSAGGKRTPYKMVPCKTCGGMVSLLADNCPHCGVSFPSFSLTCPRCQSDAVRLTQKIFIDFYPVTNVSSLCSSMENGNLILKCQVCGNRWSLETKERQELLMFLLGEEYFQLRKGALKLIDLTPEKIEEIKKSNKKIITIVIGLAIFFLFCFCSLTVFVEMLE